MTEKVVRVLSAAARTVFGGETLRVEVRPNRQVFSVIQIEVYDQLGSLLAWVEHKSIGEILSMTETQAAAFLRRHAIPGR